MPSPMPKPSSSSVVVRSVDYAAVRRAVDEYVQRLLATRPEIEEIVIFGSFEQGNYAPGSDLDVFIILSQSDQPVRDRISALLPGRFPVPTDVFPYTRGEMRSLTPSPLLEAVAQSRWRYRR